MKISCAPYGDFRISPSATCRTMRLVGSTWLLEMKFYRFGRYGSRRNGAGDVVASVTGNIAWSGIF